MFFFLMFYADYWSQLLIIIYNTRLLYLCNSTCRPPASVIYTPFTLVQLIM